MDNLTCDFFSGVLLLVDCLVASAFMKWVRKEYETNL